MIIHKILFHKRLSLLENGFFRTTSFQIKWFFFVFTIFIFYHKEFHLECCSSPRSASKKLQTHHNWFSANSCRKKYSPWPYLLVVQLYSKMYSNSCIIRIKHLSMKLKILDCAWKTNFRSYGFLAGATFQPRFWGKNEVGHIEI